jgi:energy-converting hydrogenase Eha subunit C
MSDQRPQYGELATPEEQRRAAGLPPLSEVAPAAAEPIAAAAAPASTRHHPVDRFATIALLAYGLVNVVMTGMSYLDLPTVLNEVMKILGIEGEFTDYAAGRLWGTVAAIVLVIGWTATAVLSVRRLRRGRITWWLPLVGAVVTSFLAGICVMIAMMGDPAFAEYIVKAGS